MSVSHSNSIDDKLDSLTLWMSKLWPHSHLFWCSMTWPNSHLQRVVFFGVFSATLVKCMESLATLSKTLQVALIVFFAEEKIKFSNWEDDSTAGLVTISTFCPIPTLWNDSFYFYRFLQAWNYFPIIVEGYQLLQTPAHLFCRDMQGNENFTKPLKQVWLGNNWFRHTGSTVFFGSC